jgi:hypothetical protein
MHNLQRKWLPKPTFDDNAKSGFILQQLYQAFRNADPAEEHQKAIPMSVISELGKKTILELSTAVLNLRDLEYSLPADLVNTSKYLQQNMDEQKSSAFKTFDFSKKMPPRTQSQ